MFFSRVFSKEKLLSIFQVNDFILIALPVEEGPQEGRILHYVGRIMAIEEAGRELSVSFLRIKSLFSRDNFVFPAIEDVTMVAREQCLGVVTTRRGTTQRQANW